MGKNTALNETPKMRLRDLAEDTGVQKKVLKDMPMLNTRTSPELIKRIRICCAHEEKTMTQFINATLDKELKKLGY